MSYFEKSFSHGGAGAYREIVNLLTTNGWSLIDGAALSLGPAAALDSLPVAQPTNVTIETLPQDSLFSDMDLPICWIRPTVVKRQVISGGLVTILVEGVDYRMDYRKGTIQAMGAGWSSNGSERFLISQGDYDIRSGWLVFSSPGLSTQETNLFMGLRLVSVGPYNGSDVVGVEWTLFKNFTPTLTNYFDTDESIRNKESLSVLSLIHPTSIGTIYCNVNADLFEGSISIPEAHNAWAYCGAAARIKPVLEQPCISYMLGSNSELVGTNMDDSGPVGDPSSRGNTADGITRGTVWREDIGQFSSDSALLSADLNAHFWTKKVDGGPTDIVPSQVEVTPGERYFELHPVACAYNAEDTNLNPDSTFGRVYGTATGLFSVVKYLIQHRTEVVHLGNTYTLLKVGRSINRFIAIRQD